MSRRLQILVAAAITLLPAIAIAQPYGEEFGRYGYPPRERYEFAPTGRDLEQREFRQRQRIADGIRRGQITRGEARDLYRRQGRIHELIRVARYDGFVSRNERERILRALDDQDRRIFRDRRYDDRNRWPPYPAGYQ